MAELNFFDIYALIAIAEEIVPKQSFFRDRYFPSGADDIINADKVLTEYRKGDRKMAAFVSERIGSIPMDRRGYAIHEYEPANIGVSRTLTIDDLKKRGFGEALYPGLTKMQRAARIQRQDMQEMDARIQRREEWMAVQTMINNGCPIQEYIDAKTLGELKYVYFYDGVASEHLFTVAAPWNSGTGDFFGDVRAMCRMLSRRGLHAVDLVLGIDVADAILEMEKVQKLLDKNSGIIGEIDQQLSAYDGVVYMGTLNFGGFRLNLISVDETYTDENDQEQRYFPPTSAMVCTPNCGSFLYAKVTQIDFGSSNLTEHAGKRVPKLEVDQANDMRKVRLVSRPLAVPQNYCPYIYAANVVV